MWTEWGGPWWSWDEWPECTLEQQQQLGASESLYRKIQCALNKTSDISGSTCTEYRVQYTTQTALVHYTKLHGLLILSYVWI